VVYKLYIHIANMYQLALPGTVADGREFHGVDPIVLRLGKLPINPFPKVFICPSSPCFTHVSSVFDLSTPLVIFTHDLSDPRGA
jgi:hypothetical protein